MSEIRIPEEVIIGKIYEIRGQKVMIDRDLAELYGVRTKVLKQSVRRNISRFPDDFMFEMNKKELEYWRSQNVTSNGDRMGLRYAPFCFTEQGVTMLSCVLNSDQAIAMNIRIIRTFVRMRELLITNSEIIAELETIRNEVGKNKIDIGMILKYLKEMESMKTHKAEQKERARIGYKRKDEI